MGCKIRKSTNPRQVARANRKKRIRRKFLKQQSSVARVIPFRSNRYLYVQLVDPITGKTVTQANTREKDFAVGKSRKSADSAKVLGKLLGERAKSKKVETAVFDRNGYSYHGTIKAIAEGAREAGLKI